MFYFFKAGFLARYQGVKLSRYGSVSLECAPPDLLCITCPRCAGDIMTYKRKRMEKFHPSISTGREQTAVAFEVERG